MVGIKSNGRLGNQMFQFAFIYSHAKTIGTGFFIDKTDKLHYFECSKKYGLRIKINRLKAKILQKLGKLPTRNINHSEKNFLQLLNSAEDQTFFTGFFQSLQGFGNHAEDIKMLFKVKQKFRLTQHIDQSYIGIHIRLGDYQYLNNPILGNDIALSKKFYFDALKKLDGASLKIVVVSDNIAQAKNCLPSGHNYTFHQGTEIEDFQVLMHADKLVISNSTFSWWAAFLNTKSAEVIAPKHWMGTNTKKVYPPFILEGLNWTLIDN